MHQMPLIPEVVRVHEDVFSASGRSDEPVSADLIEPKNPAYSHHAYHLSLKNQHHHDRHDQRGRSPYSRTAETLMMSCPVDFPPEKAASPR
jgi:hypothetical protein